jgi:hypothetical protein
MRLGKVAKNPKGAGPDGTEEKEYKEENLPSGGMLSGPEEAPIATIWGREPKVLNDNGDEEPLENVKVNYWHCTCRLY